MSCRCNLLFTKLTSCSSDSKKWSNYTFIPLNYTKLKQILAFWTNQRNGTKHCTLYLLHYYQQETFRKDILHEITEILSSVKSWKKDFVKCFYSSSGLQKNYVTKKQQLDIQWAFVNKTFFFYFVLETCLNLFTLWQKCVFLVVSYLHLSVGQWNLHTLVFNICLMRPPNGQMFL